MTDRILDEAEGASATAVLSDLVDGGGGDTITLGDMVDALEERAFGLVLLILALPCAIPFLYGVPQVVSIPMLFVGAQAAWGRQTLWLPDALRSRSMRRADLRGMLARAKPWLERLEVLAHPRLTMLTGRRFDRLFGLVMLIAASSIALPLPLTNTVPGIGMAILAVGMIERDGLLMLAGSALAMLWVAMLLTVGTALLTFAAGLIAG